MVKHGEKELWLAFIASIIIAGIYFFLVVTYNEIPGAGDFIGHSLGVLGFVLMVMTETLYTRRKRSRSARWGKMSDWLQFHIFTGLVGPFLVLLHTSWKFNGLAGIVSLLTLIVVLSGFVGRYIYTAVPRTDEGAVLESEELDRQIIDTQQEIETLLSDLNPNFRPTIQKITRAESRNWGAVGVIFGRWVARLMNKLNWVQTKRQLRQIDPEKLENLEKLVTRKQVLSRQLNSLAAARRLLALWHIIHVPLGMSMFLAALIHIVAAFYYSTLLR